MNWNPFKKTANFAEKQTSVTASLGLDVELMAFIATLQSASKIDITYDDINLVLNDANAIAKLGLLFSKAVSYRKALDYQGVSKRVSKFVDDYLIKSLNWDDFYRYVFLSMPFGKSIIYVEWDEQTKLIKKFHNLDYRSFSFNTDIKKGDIGDLIYMNVNITKKYPFNFIVVKSGQDFQYQNGQSILRQIRNIIKFKNYLIQTEAKYFSRAAVPAVGALYKTDKQEDALEQEAATLSAQLAALDNGSGIALPNVDQLVSLISNSQINFQRTYAYLDSQVSIRILGSDLTDSKTYGTMAQSKIASQYIEGNVKQLATVLQDNTNLAIQWACEAQFAGVTKSPQYVYDFKEPYTLEYIKFCVENNFPVSKTEASKVLPIAKGYIDLNPDSDILLPMPELYQNKNSNNADNATDDTTKDDNVDTENIPGNTDDK